MSAVEKFVAGIMGIALVTTLILPGRQSAQVINAVFGGVAQNVKNAMGR